MASLTVGIIESDAGSRAGLGIVCDESGWKPVSFASIEEFLARQARREIALLLYSLPGGQIEIEDEPGVAALRAWRQARTQTQLVLLVDKGFVPADRLALILGARHILHKPYRAEDLTKILSMAAQGIGARKRKSALEKRARERQGFEEIIAESEAMERVIDLARKVARSDTTSIMVTGECGTGKGALAKAMHIASPRGSGPFIEVNCAAIPRNLLESEFFGYEKGAFTDAREEKMGLFECANGGTIFLDEVGEIDYSLQAKLLKFLDTRTIRRVSGTRFLPVDVRVISATNRDLRVSVEERRFREDLFYRLNVVEVHIPPLRERVEDIRPIAVAYADRFAQRLNKGALTLSEEAIAALERYSWPGNVRELINVIERAVLLNVTGKLEPAEFPFVTVGREAMLPIKKGRETVVIDLPPEGISLELAEKALIAAALARTGGNVTRAASLLRVGRGTLRYKMKKHGIENAEVKENSRNGSFEPSSVSD
jgi:two-component system response regulator AtoC